MTPKEQKAFDEEMMATALKEAKTALLEGEAPIGAVIVKDGEVVSTGRNTRETKKTALGHAEIEAIAKACEKLGSWRLSGCTMYVTLEPCPMCAGAIINARIDRVVYGAKDDKAGSMGTLIDLSKVNFNHNPRLTAGIMAKESAELLSEFFISLREKER
ncbi:MAG: nucleoside deaminase [Oscillospiraceae bacterium]|nr:nucleoside deaminase [Oscillospiraceae bacterium]